MFLSAFLAGSVVPLSSEFVLMGLVAVGGTPFELLFSATAGNTLGSCFNYWLGSLGKEEWIERWTKIKPEQLERGKRHVRRFGYWAGLMAWIPVLGELITVALGYLRTNFPLTMFTIFVGKLVRYWLIIAATTGALSLF
ncbi:YqaA family protein [Alloprevotella sp. OH1205_COT-284]|uniref:YqaA family protein n=1 Tax=Alloprevotella sp. OH1205_COT-284 TaxID=2491043 RepID=UPI001F17846D|nr:YqaA family protein [Alloprevotella sp. OH1205_COT-284]